MYPILMTLFGMITEVKEEQELNAPFPIVMTLLGMLTTPTFPTGHRIKVVLSLLYRMPLTLA